MRRTGESNTRFEFSRIVLVIYQTLPHRQKSRNGQQLNIKCFPELLDFGNQFSFDFLILIIDMQFEKNAFAFIGRVMPC